MVGSNNGPYGTYGAGYGAPINPKAAEAQLLSQATSTAMIAARSILMAGGSEEVALKTAKAAAESVLNPTVSDNETISGRSTTFLRRRKAKRQAEVVASMALMSAASNVNNGMNIDCWGSGSTDQNRSLMNPYTRAITTRSMHTQDEPSVLSGSTRPPKVPTPRSLETSQRMQPRQIDQNYAPTEPMRSPSPTHTSLPPLSPTAQPLPSQPVNTPPPRESPTPKPLLQGPASARTQSVQSPQKPSPNFATKKSGLFEKGRSRKKADKAQTAPLEDPIYYNNSEDDEVVNQSETMDSRDQNSIDDDDGDDDATLDQRDCSSRRDGKKETWKHLDPLLFSFTNAFNLLSCGPMTAFMGAENDDTDSKRSNSRSKKAYSHSQSSRNEDTLDGFEDNKEIFSGDETDLDDRDDDGTDFRSEDSYDQSNIKNHLLSESASSNSSVGSSTLLRELNSNSSSEGEIQVRSSIRETMEKVVSKSKKGLQDDSNIVDRTWLSYELRQDDGSPEVATSNVKPKPSKQQCNTPSKSGKKSFFFKRRSSCKKQSF
jgi:hypothetical protein